jgi:FAD/FMN-containing dehydrogenase
MTSIAEQLKAGMTGGVITPEDHDYDAARTVFYGGIDSHPGVIARVANSADVALVINTSRENNVELAVRGGGHSVAGHSTTEGGIVLDLGDMKALDLDVEARVAWAETGLTAIEYLEQVTAHDLVTGFGDAGSVGIGGITLGGGVGFLVRKHGLTIDSLLAAELVTADGELVVADEETNPDLFWAIRGGGGNFGVATRLQFRLHPVDSFVGGLMILPATEESIAGFIAESEEAPEELSTIANVMTCPPMPFVPDEAVGSLVIMSMIAWTGDEKRGLDMMGRFRALAEPLADMTASMPFTGIYMPEDPDYKPLAVARTMFTDRFDASTARTILEHLDETDAPMRVAQIRVLGGALTRVPNDATAFAHRDRNYLINVAAFYEGPDDMPARVEWVDRFAGVLNGGDHAGYVGFLADEGPDRVRAAYPGDTWDRLRQVKAKYDPDNFFDRNQNIPPSN